MSRSQDALKRTEPERDSLRMVETDPKPPCEPFVSGPLPVAANPEMPLPQVVARLEPLADSITPETLLDRCPYTAWRPDEESMLFFGEKDSARGTEEFRALRSRLYQVKEKQPLKSLLITSAMREEGKSFIAANLAHALALQPECRVLLIDADMRDPWLHTSLGTSQTPGLSEYLCDEAEEFGIMQKGRIERLFFVPAGRAAPGPTELLSNGRLRSLLERVEPLFDWIIVDSPAALPVSDASSLGKGCDGVLLVVRSGCTPFDVVRKAREKFRERQLVGVVLNSLQHHPSLRMQQHYS